MSELESAIAYIRRRACARTPEIAAELGLSEYAVDAMLEPARADGRLITCTVHTGGREVIEYRCSAAGQGHTQRAHAFRALAPNVAAAPPRAEPTSSSSWSETPEAAQAATPSPTTGGKVTVRDRIEVALRDHGPMDAAQLRKHVKVEGMPSLCSGLWKRGILRKLGGDKRSTVYGLPGQKLEERKSDDLLERGAELGRKRQKAKKAAPRRESAA